MVKPIGTYKHWDLYNKMPDGWVISKSTSFGGGYFLITNGKSLLKGGKEAALKQDLKAEITKTKSFKYEAKTVKYIQPAKAEDMNNLARQQLKQYLLNDILCDLQICILEGWDTKTYISELKSEVDNIYNKFKKGSNNDLHN